MGLIRQVAALLFIIAIPVALITTNVRIAANEPRVHEYAIDHYGAVQRTGIPRDELLRGSGELRDYFNNGEAELFVRVKNNEGDFVSLFNRQETLHLRDVKTLFQASFRVQEAAIIFVLAYVVGIFIWARESSLRTLARQVLLSGLVSLAVVAVVGAIAVSGFDQAWDQLHQIGFSFTNNPWQFNTARDHLIQMFPEAFWRDVSLWVGIGTVAELATLAFASAVYLGVTRRSEESYPIPRGAQAQAR